VLLSAVELDMLPALAEPKTAEEVAAACGTDARATRIVLDALVALGVASLAADRYAIAAGLQDALGDGPTSVVPILRHNAHLWRSWSRLSDVVRDGKPRVDPYEDDQRPDEHVQAFIGAMAVVARAAAPATAAALDLAGVRSLLDVGGGPASYARALCDAASALRVTILDLPRVCDIARGGLSGTGYETRIGFVPGEARSVDDSEVMAASGGGGFDIVFASNLIHSMAPEQVRELLKRMVGWVKPAGRVVVKDFFVDDTRTSPGDNAIFAVNMLVNTPGGRSYGWAEVESWLADARAGEATRIELRDGRSGIIDYRLAAS